MSSLPSAAFALLILAGAEVWLRQEFESIERVTGATAWQVDRWRGLTYFWDEYDPNLGWTNLPGYRSDSRVPFQVSINAQRLRGRRTYTEQPPVGLQRIAVLGDSCVFGEEVDDDETVPHFLERALEGTEVLNFGVRGYGLGQMMLRLEQDGLALKPGHVVVVVLLPSDIGRDAAAHFGHNKPVFSLDEEGLRVGNVPVPIASREPWVFRTSFLAAWLLRRPEEWPERRALVDYLAVSRAILERLSERTEPLGIDLTLVTIATAGTLQDMSKPRERARIDAMRASLAGAGIDHLDLIGFLEEELAREGRSIVAPRGHWSAEGNRRIADQIAGHLAAARAVTQ